MGIQVSAESKLSSDKMTKADFAVYRPNVRKTAARKYGKSGGTRAVGPVEGKKGELNPWPRAKLRATQPISAPNCPWSSEGAAILRQLDATTAIRTTNAQQTIDAKRIAADLI